MHEVNKEAEWARKIAISTLIAGTTVVDVLPPGLDLRIAHEDFDDAL